MSNFNISVNICANQAKTAKIKNDIFKRQITGSESDVMNSNDYYTGPKYVFHELEAPHWFFIKNNNRHCKKLDNLG